MKSSITYLVIFAVAALLVGGMLKSKSSVAQDAKSSIQLKIDQRKAVLDSI